MPIVATEAKRLSNVLKNELWPETGYCREVAIVNEATAKTYVPGTVLGKITATGKYIVSVQTAVDGSQTAAAIVMEEKAIPATTDTKVLVLVKGPAIVTKGGLVLDASHNTGPELAAIYAALEAKGIAVNDSI
jgi:Bacteriophage lambda head decoration protein D